MAVTPTRGEQGWAKIGAVDLYASSISPVDEPAVYMPPLPGNPFPLNSANGISTPSVSVQTHPYADFWTAAQFGAWFGVGTTNRIGDITPVATLSYYDGNEYSKLTSFVGNNFSLEIVQGAPVNLPMGFIGLALGTASAGTRTGTAAPAMSSNVTFTGATGVHRCVIGYTNNCVPSGEIGGVAGGSRPIAITANPPSFSVTLLQKPGGTVPTTTMAVAIAAPGGSTMTVTMLFKLVGGPRKVIMFGETLYERTYVGMHTAPGDIPFSVAFA